MLSASRRWLFLAALALAVSPAAAQVDFGDHRSETLTAKAWDALGRHDLDAALTYVNKCISMYEAEAKKMQASLSAFPANEPKEETFRYWALNDVGTCFFIKGEILKQKADSKGATEAYGKSAELSYAQCWDPKGWFWRPGEAAKQKILELSFDAQ
jgi:hypothetical protein